MNKPDTPHDDQSYLEALVQHDEGCIAGIYDDYAGRIRDLVKANGGSAEDAGEVFQEALVDIYRQAKRGYVLSCAFGSLLYVVCRNKWLDELKRRSRAGVTITALSRFEDEAAEAAAQRLQQHEARLALMAKVAESLGPSCQNIFRLAWATDPETGRHRNLKEVAETLGVSYGYLRKKKSECEKALKERMEASPDFITLKGE